jgi:quinoprotein glucose dehydrogenase
MGSRALLLAAASAALLAGGSLTFAQSLPGVSPASMAALARGEWPAYAGTYASAKYSPLDQITRANVGTLRIAWRWESPDHAVRLANPRIDASFLHESTPIMVGGVLYTITSLSQVAALDAATGRTKWVFDPGVHKHGLPANLGWVNRGVAYWRDGDDERIIVLAAHAFMFALDAKTGKPVPGFGENGSVDLSHGLGRAVAERFHYSVTSPPVIVRDVVVVGSSILDFPLRPDMPPGDVRGFDVRTGRKLWTFRAVPGPGEVGHETWENDSWKVTGGVNVWTLMSADEDLGYVYLPFSTPTNDYYGGHRHGDNLFAESLVCVDARTGRRIWHYQIVRHGLWDYDLPAAPVLLDVARDGKTVKAVAQATKQGFVFVFDRVTGAPLWPIEDRAVPQSTVPGEKTAATQPFPTKPAPFKIQGVREEDLVDLTPELKKSAIAIVQRPDHGPLYTPPTERGAIVMPSIAGGASWSGGAWDPESGTFYVNTIRVPSVTSLRKPSFESRDSYVGRVAFLSGPGVPLFKPPWGSVVAIDMTTGEHRWRAPVGSGAYPALSGLGISGRFGWPSRSFTLVTRSLLLVVQAGYHSNPRPAITDPFRTTFTLNNREPRLSAYDKATGALLAEVVLPANASGAPMTYMAGGKQYVVFPVGGATIPEELIALALP